MTDHRFHSTALQPAAPRTNSPKPLGHPTARINFEAFNIDRLAIDGGGRQRPFNPRQEGAGCHLGCLAELAAQC